MVYLCYKIIIIEGIRTVSVTYKRRVFYRFFFFFPPVFRSRTPDKNGSAL